MTWNRTNGATSRALRTDPVIVDGSARHSVRIPAKPITHSELMAIAIPKDADHRRSEATLGRSSFDSPSDLCQYRHVPTDEGPHVACRFPLQREVISGWAIVRECTRYALNVEECVAAQTGSGEGVIRGARPWWDYVI